MRFDHICVLLWIVGAITGFTFAFLSEAEISRTLNLTVGFMNLSLLVYYIGFQLGRRGVSKEHDRRIR